MQFIWLIFHFLHIFIYLHYCFYKVDKPKHYFKYFSNFSSEFILCYKKNIESSQKKTKKAETQEKFQ